MSAPGGDIALILKGAQERTVTTVEFLSKPDLCLCSRVLGRVLFASVFLAAAYNHTFDLHGRYKATQETFTYIPVELMAGITGVSFFATIDIALMAVGGILIGSGLLPRVGVLFITPELLAVVLKFGYFFETVTNQEMKFFDSVIVFKHLSLMGVASMLFAYECEMVKTEEEKSGRAGHKEESPASEEP